MVTGCRDDRGCAGADHSRPLDADEIHRRTGSPVSYTGVIEADAGSVHPGKLAVGLHNLAIARGVIIHENSPVLEIHPGTICRLRTPADEVTAPTLVLAANAWLAGIPELRQYLYIVQSQVIATEENPQRLDDLGWRDGAAICDSQRQVLYYQRTPRGRVIFGHGSGLTAFRENFGAEFNRSTKRGRDNIAELHRVYPKLADLTITHDWAGPIDCSADHVPVFDHLVKHPNIFFGMGFNGTGIAQTPIAGRILASLALGSRDRWSESGLVGIGKRLKLPSEPFRYLGGRLVRAAIRRRNAIEIRNERPDPITRVLSDMTPGR
ncbi:NAD(P)/FAD-dependent oxidoreductase [Paracoccus methylarcula]|uniref:NAD(P)/FAD-dependent oxidoreductase n=1 Tax=Paracoccus methylarcula TaxID=72022 RepID=UPI001B881044|nr:FAD-binding oxidoreductase [Paracoccus methylarcula]